MWQFGMLSGVGSGSGLAMAGWQAQAGKQEAPAAAAEGAAGKAGGTAEHVVDVTGRTIVHDIQQGNWSFLYPLLEGMLLPAASAILILLVSYFVARFLARICSMPVQRRVDQTLGSFVKKLVFYLVMVFALVGVLGMFGVSVASFAAVLASVGFAIGLAFQGSLSHFAAGVLLLVFRPFKIGDVVSVSGITAKVNEIDLFSTTFDTFDNRRITIPNGTILKDNIENQSWHSVRRVDVHVGVDYSATLDETRKVLSAAAESLAEQTIQGEGRGYQIVLNELADSSVNWTIRLWVRTADYWSVQEQLTAATKEHLDQRGIGIPFPQLDVHLDAPPSAA